jgi:hypothetical protein
MYVSIESRQQNFDVQPYGRSWLLERVLIDNNVRTFSHYYQSIHRRGTWRIFADELVLLEMLSSIWRENLERTLFCVIANLGCDLQ